MGLIHVLMLLAQIAFSFSIGLNKINDVDIEEDFSADQLSYLALGIAKASYLPTVRFLHDGSIMENPKRFHGKGTMNCPKDKSDLDAGLCYKPCKKRSWSFSKGVGPVCWGCPTSHPIEHVALCYRKCPRSHPLGRSFLCFNNCPSGYKNHGLTCFRSGHIHNANNAKCPWYDVCGLTFSRGCSTCPAGYKNDGCTCRRDPHVIKRPRHNRGHGVVMRSYIRGVGRLPTFFRYDPTSEREACQIGGWAGKAYVRGDTEVVKFTSDQQKIVAFGFRGTEINSVQDWLAGFNFLPEEFWLNDTRLTVHRGFKNRYDKIANDFEKEYLGIPADYSILLTGHGVGAAEATIAAVVAAGKLGRAPDAVITWGSPLTGAENFKKFYRKVVGCDVTVNYVTKHDIVAKLPGVYGYTTLCDKVTLEPKTKNVFLVHNLYTGYTVGLEQKYGKSPRVKLGCHVLRRIKRDRVVEKNENVEYVYGYWKNL